VAMFTFRVRERKGPQGIEWEAHEEGTDHIIRLYSVVRGEAYRPIEDHLREAHGIDLSLSPTDIDRLEYQTWTFVRSEHVIIVHDIPIPRSRIGQ